MDRRAATTAAAGIVLAVTGTGFYLYAGFRIGKLMMFAGGIMAVTGIIITMIAHAMKRDRNSE